MDQLGIRELRNGTAAAVRRAGAGERIVITVAGRPVAQLGPLDPGDGATTLDDLASRGLVTPPRRSDDSTDTGIVNLWAGTRLDRLIADIRGS